ncbi:hypothetical protein BDF14DRAFT_1804349 [Spinellus fusiger]|nr:hypothetical protein BDF14DRAFT_1804349 [Spinellus fusiger]
MTVVKETVESDILSEETPSTVSSLIIQSNELPLSSADSDKPSVKMVCPNTSYEFERDWKTFKNRGGDLLYHYLQCIPPASYGVLFKESIEYDRFEEIIELLDTKYTVDRSNEEIADVLINLSKVKRLDMLVGFLSSKHKQALKRLLEKIKESVPDDIHTQLTKLYNVTLAQ